MNNIKKYLYLNHSFSIKNWLANSGLEKTICTKIYKMHVKAKNKIKRAYNMRFKNNDCIVTTKNMILGGSK